MASSQWKPPKLTLWLYSENIKYSEPGTYNYTIVETDDGIKDITYDTTTHNVVVTVTDSNNDGNLVCDVKYDGKSSLTIVNRRVPDIPPTGDNTPIQGLLMVFLLSVGMTVGLLQRRKREQETRFISKRHD